MPRPAYITVPLAALFYGGIALVAVVWAACTRAGLSLLVAMPQGPALPWWLAGGLVGAGLLCMSLAAERWWPAMRQVASELAGMLGPCTWPRVLALAGLSGLAEEALFRGPVQYVAGLWLTSLGFGLLHGGSRRELWPWTLFAMVAGLAFGELTRRYGSPWPATLAHVLVNAVNLRRLGRYQREA